MSKPGRWWKTVQKIAYLSFIGSAVVGISFVVFLFYLRSQALPAASILQTSEIVDSRGDLIDSMYAGQNRQVVAYDQISPYLTKATLAIEDHRFYDHVGFDFMGMARAAIVDFAHMSKLQGASTITQQLARNLYLSHERTWMRKLKEAVYTIQLEMQYSKQEILERYLNQIYYGHSAYGVQAAAEMYFHKNAKDLTLAESAMLAGIPKGPKYYSPYMNMTNAKARQKTVLQAMVNFDYITQQQADEAYQQPLDIKPQSGDKPSEAPYFRDYVIQQAAGKLNMTEDQLSESGVRIFTTLDLHAQKIAESVINKYVGSQGELQSALVAIDPRTGYIKAMVGGKNYSENQFNRVFATTRQPGSSFKPILYLAALEQKDLTPATMFKSEPTAFTYDNGRKTYMPSNFGNQYPNKDIDLREAISRSDNIYAVHTIMQIGADKVIDMARKLGITSSMKPLPSLALGTFPVSPFEMASSFGVIANQGVRVEPTAILKIEDSGGNLLYEAHPQEERVVDAADTYVLTNLMESVFDPGGTGFRVANLLKRPVAGKTGTTNTDAWMVGYTPELVSAVWVGYDRNRNISAVESHLASPIFAEFTEQALETVPPKIFPIPDGIVSVYIDPETGMLATTDCPSSKLEAFVKGTEPVEYCTVHGKSPMKGKPDSKDGKQENSWWTDLKRWWNE
ncbi:transglycosylase domain-containing protein [Ferviditalea candida]|uniref:PBP1A family penicillin-binding protein n=1 Tax=Ferviditalea candida TaxID=3108399 RepID=A0ABU5ZJL9_9BACL|nr:PBP1A family penicillin-binding protein [Paenibacillaceae bacterium T2]